MFFSGNLVDISWFRAGYSYALYLRSADVASSSGFRERTLEDFLHPSIIQSIGVRVFFPDFVRLAYKRTSSSNLSLHRNLSDGIGSAQNTRGKDRRVECDRSALHSSRYLLARRTAPNTGILLSAEDNEIANLEYMCWIGESSLVGRYLQWNLKGIYFHVLHSVRREG